MEEWREALAQDPAVAMLEAARKGDVETVANALDEGADVTSSAECGGSLLHIAGQHGQHTVLTRVMQRLVGAQLGVLLRRTNSQGNTALHLAAQSGHGMATKVLLEAGAPLDVINQRGATPIDLASSQALQTAMQRQQLKNSQTEVRLQTGAVFANTRGNPKSPVGGLSKPQRRVALVIGNDRYSGGLSQLPNCVHDAKDMAVALQKNCGFMVMVVADQTRPQMLACIRAFRQGIRRGDVVLLYFSGHGVEYEGVPFIVPIGTEAKSASDYEQEAVSLNWIIKTLNSVSGKTTNIIVLDACRINEADNTFKGGDESGLSMKGFRAPSGAEYCIALSSDPGTASRSNPSGRNSIFTEHLLSSLQNKDIASQDVEIMLRHVRQDVMEATGQRQRPWTQSCLSVDGFVFRPPES